MKLRLLVDFDLQSKRWSAVFPELPGCASTGDTQQEAVQNAKEALELWFEPAEISPSQGQSCWKYHSCESAFSRPDRDRGYQSA